MEGAEGGRRGEVREEGGEVPEEAEEGVVAVVGLGRGEGVASEEEGGARGGGVGGVGCEGGFAEESVGGGGGLVFWGGRRREGEGGREGGKVLLLVVFEFADHGFFGVLGVVVLGRRLMVLFFFFEDFDGEGGAGGVLEVVGFILGCCVCVCINCYAFA